MDELSLQSTPNWSYVFLPTLSVFGLKSFSGKDGFTRILDDLGGCHNILSFSPCVLLSGRQYQQMKEKAIEAHEKAIHQEAGGEGTPLLQKAVEEADAAAG